MLSSQLHSSLPKNFTRSRTGFAQRCAGKRVPEAGSEDGAVSYSFRRICVFGFALTLPKARPVARIALASRHFGATTESPDDFCECGKWTGE